MSALRKGAAFPEATGGPNRTAADLLASSSLDLNPQLAHFNLYPPLSTPNDISRAEEVQDNTGLHLSHYSLLDTGPIYGDPWAPLGTEEPANPQSAKESSRAYVACIGCRSRKIRCDGLRPVCTNCAGRSCPCDYDPKPRRRGPDKQPGMRKRSSKGTSLHKRRKSPAQPDIHSIRERRPPTNTEANTSARNSLYQNSEYERSSPFLQLAEEIIPKSLPRRLTPVASSPAPAQRDDLPIRPAFPAFIVPHVQLPVGEKLPTLSIIGAQERLNAAPQVAEGRVIIEQTSLSLGTTFIEDTQSSHPNTHAILPICHPEVHRGAGDAASTSSGDLRSITREPSLRLPPPTWWDDLLEELVRNID